MIVLNANIPQMSLVLKTRKATVETILKQLEYVTKGTWQHKQYCFNLKRLYSLVAFSSLVL